MGGALPSTETAALAESASEQIHREEGVAEATAAQTAFAAQPLACCTVEPRQQGQAAATQPSFGPVEEQAAGCDQPARSSDQMVSCSEAGPDGAAQEQEAGCGQAAAQKQEAGC